MNFFRVLRQRHIAVLWLGQVLSAIGDELFLVAIMWLAVQQVGSYAGFVLGAASTASLLVGMFGGVFADSWDRRRTLVTIDIVRCLLVGTLPLVALVNGFQAWYVIFVIVVIELLGTVFNPALEASIPTLAGDKGTLYATNGLMETTYHFARIFGPGMTGILLLLLPITHFFTINAASFGLSAVALLSLGYRLQNAPTTGAAQPRLGIKQVWNELMTGVRLVRNHRSLGWTVGSLAIINFAWSMVFTVGVPLFTNQVLRDDAGVYGLLIGAYGVGNLFGVFINNLGRHRPIMSLYLGKIVQGLAFIVLAFTSSAPIAIGAAFVAATGGAFGDLTLTTMMQTEFPPEHVGKVYSVRRTLGGIGITVGLMGASVLFQIFSVPMGMIVSGGLIAAIGAVGVIKFFHE